jgi:hypothetical protein
MRSRDSGWAGPTYVASGWRQSTVHSTIEVEEELLARFRLAFWRRLHCDSTATRQVDRPTFLTRMVYGTLAGPRARLYIHLRGMGWVTSRLDA